MARVSFVLFVLALTAALLGGCFPGVMPGASAVPAIVGSGTYVDKTYDLTGFTSVEVSAGARAHIAEGATPGVKISINENAAPYLKVEKEGNRLVIGLRDGSYKNVNITAEIVMPELTGVIANGGSRVNFEPFETAADVSFNSNGGASITGQIDSGDAAVTASGGADITLSGKGANLILNQSGGGTVKLGDYAVRDAAVVVNGGSHSEINASGKVTGSVNGGAELKVTGPAQVEVSANGGGRVLK